MKEKNDTSTYRTSHLDKGKDYDDAIYAGDFNTYMAEMEDWHIRKIIAKLYPNRVPRLLDFACGTGRITKTVEQLSDITIAVDVSETMLAEAKKKCTRTEFFHQDIVNEPFDIEPVNVVTAFRFFGNAEDELRNGVLSKLSNLVIPSGQIIINNHRNPSSLHELLLRFKGEKPETDLNYWKLKRILANHGFEIKRTIGIALWACTHSLKNRANTANFRKLEALSRLPFLGPLSPDMIIVAQKT